MTAGASKACYPYFEGRSITLALKQIPRYMGSAVLFTLTLSKQVTLGESMGCANLSGCLGVRLGSVRMLNLPQDLELGLMTGSKIGMMGNANQQI
jgi:hypothetical protein